MSTMSSSDASKCFWSFAWRGGNHWDCGLLLLAHYSRHNFDRCHPLHYVFNVADVIVIKSVHLLPFSELPWLECGKNPLSKAPIFFPVWFIENSSVIHDSSTLVPERCGGCDCLIRVCGTWCPGIGCYCHSLCIKQLLLNFILYFVIQLWHAFVCLASCTAALKCHESHRTQLHCKVLSP